MAIVRTFLGEALLALTTSLVFLQVESHRARVLVLSFGIALAIALLLGSVVYERRKRKRAPVGLEDEILALVKNRAHSLSQLQALTGVASEFVRAATDALEAKGKVKLKGSEVTLIVGRATERNQGMPVTPVKSPPSGLRVRFGPIRTTTELSRGGSGDTDVDVYRIPVSLEGSPADSIRVCATLRFQWVRRPNAFRGLWSSAPPHPECVELATDGVERELDVLNVIPEGTNAQQFRVPFWSDGQASVSILREQQDFDLELRLGDQKDVSQWSLIPQVPSREWIVRGRIS